MRFDGGGGGDVGGWGGGGGGGGGGVRACEKQRSPQAFYEELRQVSPSSQPEKGGCADDSERVQELSEY